MKIKNKQNCDHLVGCNQIKSTWHTNVLVHVLAHKLQCEIVHHAWKDSNRLHTIKHMDDFWKASVFA